MLLAAAVVCSSAPAEEPPCPGRVAWLATPEECAGLVSAGGTLAGVNVVVVHALGRDVARTTETVAALSARGARVAVLLTDAGTTGPRADEDVIYAVRTTATALRASRDGLEVGIGRGGPWLPDVTAYVDFVVSERVDPGLPTLPRWALVPTAAHSVDDVLELSTRQPGRLVIPLPRGEGAADIVAALARLHELFPEDLVPLAPDAGPRIESDGAAVRVFLNPRTLEVIAWARQGRSGPRPTLRLTPSSAEIVARAWGSRGPITELEAVKDGALSWPQGADSVVLVVRRWEAARVASEVDVAARAGLSVEEIVARHQVATERQRRLVPRLISAGSLTVAFQAPGLAAPLTLTAGVTLFESGARKEIAERDLRLGGVAVSAPGKAPRLPLLEPEPVAVKPLALALGDSYRYVLAGEDVVARRRCYVVAFEPRRESRHPLLRGRAWITADTFLLARSEVVQEVSRGPIVSSSETLELAPRDVGGREVWLPRRQEIHQIYEGPGHRTPVHRVLDIDRQEVDPPDFDRRLREAHEGDGVMVEDSPMGLRYLTSPGSGRERRAEAPPRYVLTAAVGVLSDPGIEDPVPYVGLGLTGFDVAGGQVNAFLAGAFLRAAMQSRAFTGRRLRVHAYGFASLVEYNDRVFRHGAERYDETLRQRPFRVSAGASLPLGPRSRIRADYELGYTRLAASDLTASTFVAPVSPLVHGGRMALEAERGPWSVEAQASVGIRQRWEAWGLEGAEDPTRASARWGVKVGRSLRVSPGLLGRTEWTWSDGHNLDRFSRYAVDGFENRLVGYPAWSVRYDRGLLGRTSLTTTGARGARVTLFADVAVVEEPDWGRGFRTLPGAGASLDVSLPGRIAVSAEWGYGFGGRDPRGHRGTQVVRLTAFRIF